MRKTRLSAIGLVAATAAVSAPAALGSAASTRMEAPPATRTIHVTAQLLTGDEIDLGAPGRSVGDETVFSGLLFTTTDPARRVGRFGGYCVLDDLARNAGQCAMTATLAGDQISVVGEQEAIPTPRTVANAVTGGTGAFRRVRGQVIQQFVTPATRDLTFQLSLR
jgi:hypothetical protein